MMCERGYGVGFLGWVSALALIGCSTVRDDPPETRGAYMYAEQPWELRDYIVLSDLIMVGYVSAEEPEPYRIETRFIIGDGSQSVGFVERGKLYRIMVDDVLKGNTDHINGDPGVDGNLRFLAKESHTFMGGVQSRGYWYVPRVQPEEQAIFLMRWNHDYTLLCDPLSIEEKPRVRALLLETRGWLPEKM